MQKDSQMKQYSQDQINLEINNGNYLQLKLLRVMKKNIMIDSGIWDWDIMILKMKEFHLLW